MMVFWIEPVCDLQLFLVAVIGDGHARNVLHHKVGLPVRRCSGVKNLRDRRMVHQRERLAFILKPHQRRAVEHPSLDELQSDSPLHRRRLLRQPNLSHAALSELADQTVWPDEF